MAHVKMLSQKTSTHSRHVKISCDSMHLSYATSWLCPSFLGIGHGIQTYTQSTNSRSLYFYTFKIFCFPPDRIPVCTVSDIENQLIQKIIFRIKGCCYWLKAPSFYFFLFSFFFQFHYDASVFQFRELSTICVVMHLCQREKAQTENKEKIASSC